MALATTIEGTWDDLALGTDEFRGRRLRLTVLHEDPDPGAGENSPKNMAEFLGDLIGADNGSGGNNSEDTGKKFADHLIAKHQDNCL